MGDLFDLEDRDGHCAMPWLAMLIGSIYVDFPKCCFFRAQLRAFENTRSDWGVGWLWEFTVILGIRGYWFGLWHMPRFSALEMWQGWSVCHLLRLPNVLWRDSPSSATGLLTSPPFFLLRHTYRIVSL